MPSDRVDGEKGVGKVDGEIVRVGESAGGHGHDARMGWPSSGASGIGSSNYRSMIINRGMAPVMPVSAILGA
jgi:hypothetical protein